MKEFGYSVQRAALSFPLSLSQNLSGTFLSQDRRLAFVISLVYVQCTVALDGKERSFSFVLSRNRLLFWALRSTRNLPRVVSRNEKIVENKLNYTRRNAMLEFHTTKQHNWNYKERERQTLFLVLWNCTDIPSVPPLPIEDEIWTVLREVW